MLRLERSRAGRARAGARRRGLRGRERLRRPRAHHARARTRTGRSRAARFGAAACAHATAAAAWACRRSEGRPFLDAARASLADCAQELGLGGRARECAAVALDALHAALGDAAERRSALPARCRGRVAVAMSGGVDSAVALLRERAGGGDVVGLTLRLWIDEQAPDAERACCSPAAVLRARESCHALGLPHVTLDGREAFRRAVVEPFVAGYARGETPNPCTTCNGSYRLAALVGAAERLGARHGGDRPLRAARRARRAHARGTRRRRRPRISRTCSRACRRRCSSGCGCRWATPRRPPCGPRRPPPAWPPRPRARARTSASSAAARSTTSSRARACSWRGQHPRRGRARARAPRRRRRLHARAAPRPRRRGADAALRAARRRRAQRARRGPAEQPRLQRGRAARGPRRGRRDARAREAARPLADGRGDASSGRPGGLRLLLDEPVYGVAAGQTAALYDDAGCVVGSGVIAPPSLS